MGSWSRALPGGRLGHPDSARLPLPACDMAVRSPLWRWWVAGVRMVADSRFRGGVMAVVAFEPGLASCLGNAASPGGKGGV